MARLVGNTPTSYSPGHNVFFGLFTCFWVFLLNILELSSLSLRQGALGDTWRQTCLGLKWLESAALYGYLLGEPKQHENSPMYSKAPSNPFTFIILKNSPIDYGVMFICNFTLEFLK